MWGLHQYRSLSRNNQSQYFQKDQLIKKIDSFTTSQRKQLLQKILERRRTQSQKQLLQLKAKRQKNQAELHQEDPQSSFMKRSTYQSVILQGSIRQQFNNSFHFIYKKERQSSNSSNIQQTPEHSCSICYQPYENGSKGSRPYTCKHFFHTKCIQNWFKTQEMKRTCPQCRSKSGQNTYIAQLIKGIRDIKEKESKIQEREVYLKDKFDKFMLK